MRAEATAIGGSGWKLDFTPANKAWYVKCPECQRLSRWKVNYLVLPDTESVENDLTDEESVAAHLRGEFSVRRCRSCLKKEIVKKYFRQD